jgi:signal transduction histidine kinase
MCVFMARTFEPCGRGHIDGNPEARRIPGFSPRRFGLWKDRPVVRDTHRGFTIAAVGSAALVVASVVLHFTVDVPEPLPVLRLAQGPAGDLITGPIYIVTGLIAWRRRPDNRIGPMMVLLGDTIVFPWVAGAAGTLGFTLAAAVDDISPVLGLLTFLSFPTGRLEHRPERVLAGAGLGAFAVLAVSELLFREHPAATSLVVAPDDAIADAVATIMQAVAVVIVIGMVTVLWLRWRRATPPARRVIAPVLWTSLVVAAVFALTYALDPLERPLAAEYAGAAVGAVPVAFLVGLLRTRLHRTVVSDLVVELGRAHSPRELREVLAGGLGDPSLELLFWLPEANHYVDADGQPTDPRPDHAFSVIEYDGSRLGALTYDPSLLEDPALVASVAAAARLAMENARLQAELQAQLLIVRDSRARIVSAADTERRRIERNLHDGAQQRLLAIRLALKFAGRSEQRDELERQLASIDTELADTLDELRALARGLHPPILTDYGLSAAVDSLARRAALPVQVTAMPSERLPEILESAAYYVAAEGLANVVKHAQASSVTIAVARMNGTIVVEVADDGRGGASLDGSGLRGLRDRVEALDGTLTITSPAGAGTSVRAELPCA